MYLVICVISQDISDLFGADLPVDGGEKVQFAWRDGPFLKALRRGDWIVLDEVAYYINYNYVHISL